MHCSPSIKDKMLPFFCFGQVCGCTQIDEKSMKNRRKIDQNRASDPFRTPSEHQNAPGGSPGAILGDFWSILGGSWGELFRPKSFQSAKKAALKSALFSALSRGGVFLRPGLHFGRFGGAKMVQKVTFCKEVSEKGYFLAKSVSYCILQYGMRFGGGKNDQILRKFMVKKRIGVANPFFSQFFFYFCHNFGSILDPREDPKRAKMRKSVPKSATKK